MKKQAVNEILTNNPVIAKDYQKHYQFYQKEIKKLNQNMNNLKKQIELYQKKILKYQINEQWKKAKKLNHKISKIHQIQAELNNENTYLLLTKAQMEAQINNAVQQPETWLTRDSACDYIDDILNTPTLTESIRPPTNYYPNHEKVETDELATNQLEIKL